MLKYLCSIGLIFLLSVPSAVMAQNNTSEFQITSSQISSLVSVGSDYRNYGASQEVRIKLPKVINQNEVILIPHEIRSDGYTQTENNLYLVNDDEKITLFKSRNESATFFNRISLVEDSGHIYVTGYIKRGDKYYSINKNPFIFDASSYLVEEAQEKDLIAGCGTTHKHSALSLHIEDEIATALNNDDGLVGIAAGELREVELATEADYEYHQALGSVSAVNARILSIVSSISAIYENTLNVKLSVVHQNVWSTSSDPYSSTNSNTMLTQFRNYWQSNVNGSVTYDLAHMWTGRDMDGSTVGIAYLDTVCSSARYGLSQHITSGGSDVVLTAHEIGHNFSADHDTCSGGASWIMCPYVVPYATQFSTASLNTINSNLSGYSCLSTVSGGANNVPVLNALSALTVNESATVTATISATDPDGDPLTYFLSSPPSGASVSGNTLSYSPSYDVVTTAENQKNILITYGVRDNRGGETTRVVSVLVRNINRAPTGTSSISISGQEGQPISRALNVSDPDGDTITYSLLNSVPNGLSVSTSTGQITWTPSSAQSGSYSFTIRARDTGLATFNVAISISISNVNGGGPAPTPTVNPTANPTANPSGAPTPTPTPYNRKKRGDLNGLGKSSFSVYRNETGTWYYGELNSISNRNFSNFQFGLMGDIPILGDYDGDGKLDRTVYRHPGLWFILMSSTNAVQQIAFGLAGDVPVPGNDYDGDAKDDLAIYRRGQFIYRSSITGINTNITIGGAGYVPVPCDYDGDGKANIAVFELKTGTWLIRSTSGQISTEQLGLYGDYPVPGFFDSSTVCSKAVWRPSNGYWYYSSGETYQWGLPGDLPLAGDYDGNGYDEPAVWRSNGGMLFVRYDSNNHASVQLGLAEDRLPQVEPLLHAMRKAFKSESSAGNIQGEELVSYDSLKKQLRYNTSSGLRFLTTTPASGSYMLKGDFNGDGKLDYANYNRGTWGIAVNGGSITSRIWGLANDVPLVGDFDGDGISDLGVYRPYDSGEFSRWYVVRSSDGGVLSPAWGIAGDIPMPMDINGDGRDDFVVLRPSNMVWYVQDSISGVAIRSHQWGLAGDLPCKGDFNDDGYADICVYRKDTSIFYIRLSGGGFYGIQWGLGQDIPFTYGTNKIAVYRKSEGVVYSLSPKSQLSSRLSVVTKGSNLQVINNLPVLFN